MRKEDFLLVVRMDLDILPESGIVVRQIVFERDGLTFASV